MLWSKKARPSLDGMELAEICLLEAETLYRSGGYNCAEAVMEVVRKHFAPDTPESMINAVSGFGGGSGSGCICGAVAAGTAALGMVLKDRKVATHLTRELHSWFREKYGVTCCKTIRQTHKGACPVLTGEVAEKIAEMLSRH